MGITFAPEAGSERLRQVINKPISDKDIVENVNLALKSGFEVIKLYFMIGLPTETASDIEAIIDLVNRIHQVMRGYPGRKFLNIAVSTFCPKPQTPFEREALLDQTEIRKRAQGIKRAVKGRRVRVHWADGRLAAVETIFARGGRELTPLIIEGARRNLLLQACEEHFNFSKWLKLFEDFKLPHQKYVEQKELQDAQPWDFLMQASQKSFLLKELQRAKAGEITEACRVECTDTCGACDKNVKPVIRTRSAGFQANRPEKTRINKRTAGALCKYRFTYAKGTQGRFIPHLDMVRLFERAFRVAGIPPDYSKGFSSRPRMSFFYPLPLGYTGVREQFTANLTGEVHPHVVDAINRQLPEGLAIRDHKSFEGKALTEKDITGAEYEIHLPDLAKYFEKLKNFSDSKEWNISIARKKGVQEIDAKRRVVKLEYSADCLVLHLSMKQIIHLRVHDFLQKVLEMAEDDILPLNIVRTGFIFNNT
jgi:radical SAM-linked protein